MQVEDLLDLAWVEVLAAADDHVLDAADDVQIALTIERSEIARVHPTLVVDRGARGRSILPVPGHQSVAARADLARSADGLGEARLGVDDFRLDVRHDGADRRDPTLERVIGPRHEGN